MSNAGRLNTIFHSVSNTFNRSLSFDVSEGELEISIVSPDEIGKLMGQSVYDMRIRISIDTVTHKGRFIKLENVVELMSPSDLAEDVIYFETDGHPFTRKKKETAAWTAPIYVEFTISSPFRIKEDMIEHVRDKRSITFEFEEPNEPGEIVLDSARHQDISEDFFKMEISGESLMAQEPIACISLEDFITYLKTLEDWRDFDFAKVVKEDNAPTPAGGDNVHRLG